MTRDERRKERQIVHSHSNSSLLCAEKTREKKKENCERNLKRKSFAFVEQIYIIIWNRTCHFHAWLTKQCYGIIIVLLVVQISLDPSLWLDWKPFVVSHQNQTILLLAKKTNSGKFHNWLRSDFQSFFDEFFSPFFWRNFLARKQNGLGERKKKKVIEMHIMKSPFNLFDKHQRKKERKKSPFVC